MRDILKYKFHCEQLDKEAKELIPLFLEASAKNTNKWFSNIPSFLAGIKSHIDVIKLHHKLILENNKKSKSFGSTATAKLCPAIQTLLDEVILIKSPCDILITISSDGSFVFETSEKRLINISTHSIKQLTTQIDKNKNTNIFYNKVVVKFELPIQVGAKRGNSWTFLAPSFSNLLPFVAVSAPIPKKYAKSQPLNIITLIDVPKEITSYEVKKGEVLAYMWSPNGFVLRHSSGFKYIRNLLRTKFLRGLL